MDGNTKSKNFEQVPSGEVMVALRACWQGLSPLNPVAMIARPICCCAGRSLAFESAQVDMALRSLRSAQVDIE